MGDVTSLLDRWNDGDRRAMQDLLTLLYAELRQMADRALRRERADHTLQPTALVHELYLRFSGLREMRVESRRHFYGAAAEAMRRILVDHARMRRAQKRGGEDAFRIALDEVPEAALAEAPDLDVERLDDALRAFADVAPEKARVVELRYFAGLSVEETAAVLDLSPATVKRYWAFARAWLFREMSRAATDPRDPT